MCQNYQTATGKANNTGYLYSLGESCAHRDPGTDLYVTSGLAGISFSGF